MLARIARIRHSLVFKIVMCVGGIILLLTGLWAGYSIRHYRDHVMANVASDSDQLSNAILLGAHYAMMFNLREDINRIILNMGKLEGLEHIRIYNKSGQIKFSNIAEEVGHKTEIKAEACDICHFSEPPLAKIGLEQRKRIFIRHDQRLLGIITPIYNEPGCATSDCHAHPEDKIVLGALDVVVSLQQKDNILKRYENNYIMLAISTFVIVSVIIMLILNTFFIGRLRRIIAGTRQIAKGECGSLEERYQPDELGELSQAIDRMSREIGEKQAELKRQRNEYQNLFELVPCIISVQDRDYRLINYNREFSTRFAPKPGDHCYSAYKGRSTKCKHCPVEKTFSDGEQYYSEESGINKDGSVTHWIVKTSPMKNEAGEIVGAMEISLDITHRKELQNLLAESEKKYYAIFNNIPNPVFVLDMDTLIIRDCNESVTTVYGYQKHEIVNTSFMEMFQDESRQRVLDTIGALKEIMQIKQMKKNGELMYVNMRISPSEYPGQKVYLVTTSDITKRLEAEMQLIQAGKMATLGEMATGVAHELNQPLSVIKTASSFFMRKIRKGEKIQDAILLTLCEEIDSHVDRASAIINHMRRLGRKSDVTLEPVNVNEVLFRAFEIFSQQLKLREIDVIWELEENLPLVMAEAGRLEQVFINLLINARDAIDNRAENDQFFDRSEKRIHIKTRSSALSVIIEVADTGVGVPAAIREKIFEPFFTTKKVGEGTGLGLSISYGIIQDFTGTIKVAPPKTAGACFVVTLPKAARDNR